MGIGEERPRLTEPGKGGFKRRKGRRDKEGGRRGEERDVHGKGVPSLHPSYF